MNALRALAAVAVVFPLAVYADNLIHPGTPVLDRPTVVSLGIQLPITGDDNLNATVAVQYRPQGTTVWKQALPLYRVHPETTSPYVIAPQFAGSILDLRPSTTYDIQLLVTDPDGVNQVIPLTGTTRAVPGDPPVPNVINVNTSDALTVALGSAQPGDVITIANGTYHGQFALYRPGAVNNPIVIRGASEDGVIIDADNCDGCNIWELYGSYIHLERMTIQNGTRGIRFQTTGGQGNVVRRVHIKNVQLGIGSKPDQLDFYIADNIIEGRLVWPQIFSDDNGSHAYDDGIHIEGHGHVVAHNRISGFGDAVKNAQTGARSLDFYNNDILWSYDDALEVDGAEGNVRLMRNRLSNTYDAVSAQAVMAGPAYLYRNVAVNTVQEQVKLHTQVTPAVEPNGILLYSNTFVSSNYALALLAQNSVHHLALENNIFMGPASPVQNMTVDWLAYIDDGLFDYNGYWPDKVYALSYKAGNLNVNSFAALQQAGLEAHGMVLNPSQTLATGISGPSDYRTQVAPQDVVPATNSVVLDKALVLPQISDVYTGSGPDLGAVELGCPEPIYGPRPENVDESNEPLGCTASGPVPVPQSITAYAGTPQSTQIGTPFALPLQAKVLDAASKPVPGIPVTFTLSGTTATSTFQNLAKTVIVATDGLGIATSPAFTANSTTGSYTASATVGSLAPVSFSLTNAPPPPPTADSATPTGTLKATQPQMFTFKYSSLGGAFNITQAYALINSSLKGSSACWVVFNVGARSFYLLNDAGNAYIGPLAIGSTSTIQNSQCMLSGSGSNVTGSGNTLTVTANVTFSSTFTGTEQIYLYANDTRSQNSGWQNRGTLNIVPLDNTLHPGTPVFDRATLVSLGIQLPITGDDNFNSSVTVQYRKHGDTAWKQAQNLFRVHPDTTLPYVIAPQFAGSILDLRPATTYDIQLTAIDSDGGLNQTISMTGTTRSVPGDPASPHIVNVNDVSSLNTALDNARAGDVIILANGTYAGQFGLYHGGVGPSTGVPENPIVIRGQSQDGVILDGQNCGGCNVLEVYGDYVHVERMTIQNAYRALRFFNVGTHGSIPTQGDVARRLHIRDVNLGIGSANSQLDFYIADNIVEGRLKWPSIYTDDDGLHAADDGINVSGFGHVVAHNQVSGFGKAVIIEQNGNRSVDFYGNDILWSYDAAMKFAFLEGNGRIMRNRLTNVFMGFSLQPVVGGPAYIYRNVTYNIATEQLKLHSHANPTTEPNGVFAYNNTFVSAGTSLSLESPTWVHHFALLNNVFIGPQVPQAGTPYQGIPEDWYSVIDDGLFDYNGYWPDGAFGYNFPSKYLQVKNFAALQAAGMGVEPHGLLVNPQTLANGVVGPPDYRTQQQPLNFALSTGSIAIDRGTVLPNITDAYTGAAPDIGALESGCPVPIYGPRPDGVDESNEPFGCNSPGSIPASPASISALAGTPQNASLNASYATALQAKVLDASSNPVAGVTVTFTAPASGASGTFAGGTATATATTNASGVVTAPAFTANGTAGTFNVSANFPNGTTAAVFALTNNSPAPATVTAVTGNPQSATVNTAYATALQAKVVDSASNPVAGVTVTFTAPASGASGTFAGTTPGATATATTNASGVATAPPFTANGTAGTFNISANFPNGTTPATFALTNNAQVPATITAQAGATQSATVNTAYTTALQVKVVDASSNPVAGVTVTFTAPASGASGTFTGGTATATATTDPSGLATAPPLTANGTAGTFNVSANFPNGTTAATFGLTNTAQVPKAITAQAGDAQSATINTAYGTALQAKVVDAASNPVAGVTVTFTAPASGASGAFAGTTPGATATATTNASGIATAPAFTANATTGAFNVTANFPNGTTAATFGLTNTAQVPKTITAQAGTPQSATVNAAYATALQAKVVDSASNPVAGVTVTFTAPASGASGTFTGATGTATATTNASGIATAPAFTANGTTGGFSVTANFPNGTTAATFSLTNNAQVPATITAQAGTPQSATVNAAYATALQAKVVDSASNPVAGVTVTFTAPASGASGTFTGATGTATATTNASGIATAPAFTANATTGAFNVTANFPNGTTAATFSLTNNAQVPATITAQAGTPQSATVNAAYATALQAKVVDSASNPVAGVTVTFTAPASGASGTFAGTTPGATATATTNASGIATAPAFTANATTGAFNVTANFPNGTTAATFGLTNTAQVPKTITAQAGTPQSATVNAAYATALQAKVVDSASNPVAGVTVTFTAPASGASGTFTGATGTATATTNASGIATAPAFTANGTTGGFSVTANFPNGTTAATFSLTNNAQVPATITAQAGTPQSATVNAAYATALQAKVVDSASNPVAGVTVTFTAPASGASGTFTGGTATSQGTTNASGIATAPAFTANGTTGGFNITANFPNGTTAATFGLTNTAQVPKAITAQAGDAQSATINTAYGTALQAKVVDAASNPVAGVTVTFTAPASGASGAFAGTTPGATATATTNASGIATAPAFTANATTGAFNVTANFPNGTTAATFGLTNTAQVPKTITAQAGTPQSATVNAAYATALQAKVVDSASNPVAGVTVTFTAPASGASGTFTGGTATSQGTTNASGIATAPAFTANGTTGGFSVTANFPNGTTAASFALTNNAQVPKTITAQAGDAQSATVNTAYTTALQAKVMDAASNPVAGVTVTFTAPASGASGTFAGATATATATTNASGIATAPAFTANGTTGAFNVMANFPNGTTAATFSLTNSAQVPKTITAQAGTPQSATVNAAYATALQAKVVDSGSNPVAGVNVTFTAPASGASGTFNGGTATATATTNASGIATAPAFTANGTTGGFSVTANFPNGTTAATFSLTNSAQVPATITAQAGTPQSATVNTAYGTALQAKVVDSASNPVAGVTVTFTAPAAGASGTFTGGTATATATTNASGIATAPAFTANGTTGAFNVTANFPNGTTAATFSLTNSAQVPATITAQAGTPQSATVNAAYATALQAKVVDSASNPVAGVAVTFTAPASGASGTFTGGTATAQATTNASGIATAPAFTANGTTGGFSVTANFPNGTTAATFSLTNSAQVPATITAQAGTPQSATVNAAYATALQAKVVDSASNPVAGVTVTFTAPASGASGTFSGGTATAQATTNASGIATAPAFTANGTTGPFNVTANFPNGTTAATFSLTNSAQVPATITAQAGTPQSATVNTAYGTALQAKVVDSASNPVAGVTVTFTAPASGASGTFTGGTATAQATTNASGIATAPAFTANGTTGGFSVTANFPNGTTAATFSLTNSAQVPATITAQAGTPQSATVNTAYGTALQAKVVDSASNPVAGVTVTFTAPASGASGTFTGGTATAQATTNASGIATAPAFTANGTTGPFNVTANFPNGTTAATFSLTNSAQVPATITAQAGTPQSATVNTAYGTALQAKVVDSASNPVAGVTVTFTAPASGASGTFTGGTATAQATTNASGIATAPAFTANGTTGGFSVTANFPNGTTAATFSLTNSAQVPATITAQAGTPQSATVNTAYGTALQAKVVDSASNPVAGVTVTFTAPASGASGTFSGGTATAQATTNASGIATAPAFTANGTTGPFNVTANFPNGTTAATFSLTNSAQVPATITAQAGTPQSATVNTAYGTALQAKVVDSASNPVAGVTVTFTAPASGASGTFTGGTATAQATTNASGIATAPAFTANGTTGGFSVTANFPNGTTAATFSLTNSAQVPATITAQAGTPQSATVNTAYGTALQAKVVDSASNPVAGVTVTFTAPASGASGTFSGGTATAQVTTNASGIATAPAFTANGTTGGFSVTANFPNGTTAATFSLTNSAQVPATITAQAGTPQSATVNAVYATALQAKVVDSASNPVAGVTVTFTAPASGASGTFTGGTATAQATTNASGIATAPAFTANGTTGGFSVTANFPNGTTAATFSLTNSAQVPAGITAQAGTPQSATVNAAYATALQAKVVDSASNPVAGVTVTFTAPASGASGTFTGGTATAQATTNASGIATAPAFTANGTTGGFSVTANFPNGTTAATFALTNSAQVPATITAQAGTPQSATVNAVYATALQAKVVDSASNPVAGVTVTFTAPASGASGTFTGGTATAQATTNASGIATAPAFTANGTTGGFSVTATVLNGTTPATFALTNNPATAAPPTADSVTGMVNGQSNQVLTFNYSSASGYSAITQAYALTSPSLRAANACWVIYSAGSNSFYLLNDNASAYLGPVMPGSSTTVQNSQCTLNGTGSSVSGIGNTLSLTLNLTFSHNQPGTQQIYMYVGDSAGRNSGWQNRGTVTIP